MTNLIIPDACVACGGTGEGKLTAEGMELCIVCQGSGSMPQAPELLFDLGGEDADEQTPLRKAQMRQLQSKLRGLVSRATKLRKCAYCGTEKTGTVKLPNGVRRCRECDPLYEPPSKIVVPDEAPMIHTAPSEGEGLITPANGSK